MSDIVKTPRRQPGWVGRINVLYIGTAQGAVLESLSEEVYAAREHGLLHLAVMGVRAVLEHLVVSLIGDQGSFSKNLEKFKAEGYISLPQFDNLKVVVDAGSAAIHRGFKPTESLIDAALGAMENVVESIFVRPVRLRWLSERIPERLTKRKLGGS
jgi:Domain of unknown function (DUF4145)